jgi:streptomycin 6-kinase
MTGLPKGLGWLRSSAEGRAWIGSLPWMLAECADLWELRLAEPYPTAFEALCIPATRADGEAAVLKLQFPNRESEHEAAALARCNGEGTVRLLEHDEQRHALLLERCLPGTQLAELDQDAALDVLVELLPRLWRAAGEPFRPLEEEATWWGKSLSGAWETAGQPFERALLDAALTAIEELAPSQGPPVLLHQDLHAGNVLRADREPWLAIDPKPLAGEREFGLAAIVRGDELGDGRRNVLHRLERLASELGLDYDRARRWTLVQTLAWSIDTAGAEPAFLEHHVEVARWLVEAGR